MGGHILDYPAKTIYNKALSIGKAEGRAEGKSEGAALQMMQMIDHAMANPSLNWTVEEACAMLGVKEDEYRKAKRTAADD